MLIGFPGLDFFFVPVLEGTFCCFNVVLSRVMLVCTFFKPPGDLRTYLQFQALLIFSGALQEFTGITTKYYATLCFHLSHKSFNFKSCYLQTSAECYLTMTGPV